MLKLICVCNYYCAVDKLGTGEYLHKFADFNIVVHEISSNPKTDETALEGVDQSGMQVKVHLQQSWTPHLPFKIGDVLAREDHYRRSWKRSHQFTTAINDSYKPSKSGNS